MKTLPVIYSVTIVDASDSYLLLNYLSKYELDGWNVMMTCVVVELCQTQMRNYVSQITLTEKCRICWETETETQASSQKQQPGIHIACLLGANFF